MEEAAFTNKPYKETRSLASAKKTVKFVKRMKKNVFATVLIRVKPEAYWGTTI